MGSLQRKLTKQNRCFYLRMNSGDRCTGVFDGGISFCCPGTQRVCSEKQTRHGTTARRPKLAPTSRPRRLLPGSGRVQHFQNCYHYLLRRCSHRHRLCSPCCCCCCLCLARNSPHRRSAVAGCLTSWKADEKLPKIRCVAVQSIRTVLLFGYFSRLAN